MSTTRGSQCHGLGELLRYLPTAVYTGYMGLELSSLLCVPHSRFIYMAYVIFYMGNTLLSSPCFSPFPAKMLSIT